MVCATHMFTWDFSLKAADFDNAVKLKAREISKVTSLRADLKLCKNYNMLRKFGLGYNWQLAVGKGYAKKKSKKKRIMEVFKLM